MLFQKIYQSSFLILQTHTAKGSPQTLSGHLFLKNYKLKTLKQQKGKKIKGNKLGKLLLKAFVKQHCFHVSAFVGGIKKKHSPTSAFATQLVSFSVFHQNCFQIFLVKWTRKVWKQFWWKTENDTSCFVNAEVGECFFLILPTKAET